MSGISDEFLEQKSITKHPIKHSNTLGEYPDGFRGRQQTEHPLGQQLYQKQKSSPSKMFK